jgi:hypothetical protein
LCAIARVRVDVGKKKKKKEKRKNAINAARPLLCWWFGFRPKPHIPFFMVLRDFPEKFLLLK